jgi:hypothetical protein
VLGYTNQFLTNSLTEEWAYRPFWTPIFLVWESECVSDLRRKGRTAAEWHEHALEIQRGMEALRAHDIELDEREGRRYWDHRESEGATEYWTELAKGLTDKKERTQVRAEYSAVRALVALFTARQEQGNAEEPSMDAAMLLFHAIMCAQDGDTFLEWDRRREMQALRALDHYRHEHDMFIQAKRDEMVSCGYLAPRENPVLEARLKELEAQKLAEIEKAQQAVAEERRARSSKGGTAVAKHYAEKRDQLLEAFKVTFDRFPSIAAAAEELGKKHNFAERTAEEHLRRFVAANPEFRPKRST